MSRFRWVLVGLAALVVIVSSVPIHIERPESPFLRDLQMRELIEPIVPELSRKMGWGSSATLSSHYVRFRPVYERRYTLFLHVPSGEESQFLQAVRARIDQRLRDSRAMLRGSSNQAASFFRRYFAGDSHGVIRAWGVREDGDSFRVVLEIAET
jgi:hypothetical protein